ncbi:uncharacterized protein LOC111670627 [Seriola lalandi dorsalis]|uniref:Uncharacterized LOC111670627 n=2 Tax=Seriola TaxID=8160 RepID=A0A3B4YKA4_SERLL|nr:uncharacterized protein LOC111670627 [Seriola lalandi dorsalis]XP_056240075.1 uncharacterized protein LOC130174367 isoform X1 [Seriola aureovittata]XP_056240076.1 uncharacterized protein LOC130174367 isoform X1 [Seriola aureovittata]
MMWRVAFIFFYVQAKVMSHEIKVECREFHNFPPTSDTSPSLLAALRVEQVTVGQQDMLNISWAISIDASIEHLMGTLIKTGESSYLCKYKPHLGRADITASKQQWFHHLVKASYGSILIQATNLPLPPLGSGPSYKYERIMVSLQKQSVTPKSTQVPTDYTPVEITTSPLRTERVTGIIFGGLIGLMTLSFCYIIYKSCGVNIAKSFGFKSLPQSPMVPVPVLVVYPAENSAFQRAVVTLAEFLQWHGSCNVAIDMWQQGKIAELGPMRWLAEQAKAAERVLIICPQPSSQPSHSSPDCSLPEPSIPAAAHDLYPLILNMVAGHAKSASDLGKFWVVQLAEQSDKRPSNLSLELRACKTFCLMKDLKKLCRKLHTHRSDEKKISDLIFRPGISYSEKSTMELREAVEKHFQRGGTTGTLVTSV